MTELVGFLLVIAAIFVVLFGVRDILANLIQRFRFSNLNFMYGGSKRDRIYYHRSSSQKKKPSARPRKFSNQSEDNQTEVVNLFDDVTIRFQPLSTLAESSTSTAQFPQQSEKGAPGNFSDRPFRDGSISPAIEPAANSAEVSDRFDEEILAEIDLFKDFNDRSKSAPAPGKPIESTARLQTPTRMSSIEEVPFNPNRKVHPISSPASITPAAAPLPSQRRADEKINDAIRPVENNTIRSEPPAKMIKPAAAKARPRYRADDKVVEKRAAAEEGKLQPGSVGDRHRPTTAPIRSPHRAEEKVAATIKVAEESQLSPAFLATRAVPTTMEARPPRRDAEKVMETMPLAEDGELQHAPIGARTKSKESEIQPPGRADEKVMEAIPFAEEDNLLHVPVGARTRSRETEVPPPRHSDEKAAAAIEAAEAGRLQPMTIETVTSPTGATIPSPRRAEEKAARTKDIAEAGEFHQAPLSAGAKPMPVPAPPPRRAAETVIKKSYLAQDNNRHPEPVAATPGPAKNPIRFQQQLDEVIGSKSRRNKSSDLAPEPRQAGTQPTAIPLPVGSRFNKNVNETVRRNDEIPASPAPLTIGTKPIITLVESHHQPGESKAEDIIIFEDLKIHLSPSPAESESRENPEQAYHRFDDKSDEDMITSEDVLVDLTPATTESKSPEASDRFHQLPDDNRNDADMPAEEVATPPKPSSTAPASTAAPAQTPQQSDEPRGADRAFQKEDNLSSTISTTAADRIKTPAPFSRPPDKTSAEKIRRTKDVTIESKPAAQPKPTIIPEHSRQQPVGRSEKDINLFEGLSARLKRSKTTTGTTHIQFRSEPGQLDKAEVENLMKNYDFYDSVLNPTGKGLSHRYTAIQLSGDEIIIDEATDLIWQQNGSAEDMTLENAEKWLAKLNRDSHGGFQDWRFPSLEETMSLMEAEQQNNGLHIDPQFNKRQEVLWTGDLPSDESRRWIVSFSRGFCSLSTPESKSYLRAVRQDENLTDNLII